MKTTIRTGLPEVEWANVFTQANELYDDMVWRDLDGNLAFRTIPRRPSDAEIKAAKRRGKVTETAYESSIYDDSAPPENLLKFERWLRNRIIEKIPAGRERKSAKIEFDSDYESSSISIKVTYQRPETDEEWQVRKDSLFHRLKAWQDHVEQERLERNQRVATALGGTAIV